MFCNDFSFITFLYLYLFVKVTKSVCMTKECEYLILHIQLDTYLL